MILPDSFTGSASSTGAPSPVDGVSEAQTRAIATFVRELQAANGIITQPHTM